MCNVDRSELKAIVGQLKLERLQAAVQRSKDAEWARYLSCTALPDQKQRSHMNDYYNSLQDTVNENIEQTLRECQVTSANKPRAEHPQQSCITSRTFVMHGLNTLSAKNCPKQHWCCMAEGLWVSQFLLEAAA